jgi:hypothetical protein
VQGLYSQNPQEQYEATQWFRKLLSIGEQCSWFWRPVSWLAAGCMDLSSSRQVAQQQLLDLNLQRSSQRMHVIDHRQLSSCCHTAQQQQCRTATPIKYQLCLLL